MLQQKKKLTDGLALGLADRVLGQAGAVVAALGRALAATAAVDVVDADLAVGGLDDAGAVALLEHLVGGRGEDARGGDNDGSDRELHDK